MVRGHIAISAALAILPVIASAVPIVTVTKDELYLEALVEVPLVGGGNASQHTIYKGALLPTGFQEAGADIRSYESSPSSGIVQFHAAYSYGLADTYGLDIWSQTEFGDLFGSSGATVVYDPSIRTSLLALAELSWDFYLSEDTDISLYSVIKELDGEVAIRLVDKTTKQTLVNFRDSTFGFDDFQNLALFAGHKYSLDVLTRDESLGDDSESNFNAYFGSQVTYSVPEPPTLALLAVGLFGIGLLRLSRFTSTWTERPR